MDKVITSSCIYIYRVSGDLQKIFRKRVKHVKLSKKVLYHFAKIVIVNEY